MLRLPRRRSAEQRRTGLADRVGAGVLRDYLAVPFPSPTTPVADLGLLAVDLETTGLHPGRDAIVAAGFVPVQDNRIQLSGARQFVVRPPGEVGQSATFHGLTDDVVAAGAPLDEVLPEVLGALRGRVLLAHHARLEELFLSAACERLFGGPLPCVVVDTMALEERLTRHRWPEDPPPGSMRLGAARERRGLPRYRAHDALTDAVACAELYLAQVAALGGGRLLLRDLTG